MLYSYRWTNLANSHEGTHNKQTWKPKPCSNRSKNRCNWPPDNSKTQYYLSTKFVCPYATKYLTQKSSVSLKAMWLQFFMYEQEQYMLWQVKPAVVLKCLLGARRGLIFETNFLLTYVMYISHTWVSRYPQKKDDWIRPTVALFQLNSWDIGSIAMLMFTYKI